MGRGIGVVRGTGERDWGEGLGRRTEPTETDLVRKGAGEKGWGEEPGRGAVERGWGEVLWRGAGERG